MYVYEHEAWPELSWNSAELSDFLAEVGQLQGRLFGRMDALGFGLREEATLQTLTQERLFARHAALFPTGRSGMQRITVGGWRTEASGPMQVVSRAIGRELVHYEAPSHKRLKEEMTRFLKWFNAPSDTDPVIRSALAHFWSVTIHPFEDGNGRIARAIADMMLARSEKSAQRFYSMSAQIQRERKQISCLLVCVMCAQGIPKHLLTDS